MNTFGNFMRGYEGARQQHAQDEDRRYQQSEREYQRSRRGVVDERQDVAYDQSQEDRTRTLERDQQEYPLRFQALEQQVESGGYGVKTARHQFERLPIEAEQTDSLYAENMANSKQQRGIRGAQEGRAAAQEGRNAAQEERAAAQYRMSMALSELQLDEAKLSVEHQNFARSIGAPARQFAINGDLEPLNEALTQVVGQRGGVVKIGEDRYGIRQPDGKTQEIGTREDVLSKLSTLSQRPEVYLEMLYQRQAGVGQQRAPASIQEIEYIRSILPRREGESEQEHALRAADYVKRTGLKDPEQEFRSIMQSVMEQQRGMGGAADPQAAAEQARQIMSQTLQQRTQPPAQSSQPAGAPAAQASPHPEGTRLRGPDGRIYVVRNGQPVPEQ